MNKQIVRRYQIIARVETVIVLLVCLFVIVGWILQYNMLTRGILYSAPMHPLAGVICIIAVLGHFSLTKPINRGREIASFAAIIIIILGATRLFEYFTGLHFEFVYNTFTNDKYFPGSTGKFAPITALCFVLIGLSMLLFKVRINKNVYPADWLCLIAALITYSRLISYLYGADLLAIADPQLAMSFMTAFSLFLLSTAMLFSQGSLHIFKLITGNYPGNRTARYLLPIAVILPLITGLLHSYSKSLDLLSDAVNIPLIILFNVFIMIGLIWRASISINKSALALEQERRRSEALKEQLRKEENKQIQNYLMEIKLKQQKELILASIDGQEKEKRKLGMDLHDHVNQILASTKLYLEVATSDPDPVVCREMISKSKEQVTNAINEIRSLSHSLIIHDRGEYSMLENMISLINNLRETTGIEVTTQICAKALAAQCTETQLSLFRIMQEQFQNVVKHARAKEVIVEIRPEAGGLYFAICDNGAGFELSKKHEGIGLKNIRTRAAALDGRLEIRSAPGEGCEIILFIPSHQSNTPNS